MSETATFCYNCGVRIEVGENFCRQCGRRSGELTEQPTADTVFNMLRADEYAQPAHDTNVYGPGSTQDVPPSYSTTPDSDIDPTPTLYSPGQNSYSQNLASFHRQASGSYSQEAVSNGGDESWSYLSGAAPYQSGGTRPSQQAPKNSKKNLFGLIICLLLLTAIGIFLGLWLSDAI